MSLDDRLAKDAQSAAQHLEARFEAFVEELEKLARIPSISFPGFPPSEVAKSAEAVAALLRRSGLENVEVLTLPGAHPYVYGERLKAPGAPTLVLYAHHDVQPPGREELWKSPPFVPTRRPGPGGERLYGRGTADDKAGILVHVAAIDSYLKTVGELPVNVKIVIEGEEEISSSHLEEFLTTYRKRLDADVLVLTDTGNFDVGIPALTTSLRGILTMEVEVRGLTKTVHSGMWGGPLPDPVMALNKILASLVDADGRIAVPGVMEQVKPLTPTEAEAIGKIPFSEKDFRAQSGMIESAKIQRRNVNPWAQIWREPSLTITAIQASSRAQAGNIICDTAWARVGVRLVPDMDADRVQDLMEMHLRAALDRLYPWGLELELTTEPGNSAWSTEPKGWAFDAASEAMKRGYGVAPYMLGSGGSIPFVQPFANALGGAPALLIGVEDPYTDAHGENESLLISDFKKSCLSQIYLFEELARRFEARRKN